MNLHVNLIEEREKRRGGSPHLLYLLRLLAVLLPIAVALAFAQLLVGIRLDRLETVRIREKTGDKLPQVGFSAEVLKQKKLYDGMLKQLDGWGAMRIDLHRQLAALRQTVPLEVQLVSLRMTRAAIVTNGAPASAHLLLIRGKTGGDAPENNLTRFRLNVLKEPELTNSLSGVDVPEGAFVEDTSPGARPMDRIFELNCSYKPRMFK